MHIIIFFSSDCAHVRSESWVALMHPGTTRLWTEHSWFHPFSPLFGCVDPIVIDDDLKFCFQLGNLCCLSKFWFCCVCLLLPWSLSVGEYFWHSHCHFFGRLRSIGSCHAVDYPLKSVWSYPSLQYVTALKLHWSNTILHLTWPRVCVCLCVFDCVQLLLWLANRTGVIFTGISGL